MMGKEFRKELLEIAVPVTLQCLFQSSFSVVDQIMTGQLGSVNIAGIGLGGKFASIYSVVIAAVASLAGIMIAQYIGKKDVKEVGRSFYTNLAVSLLIVAVFTSLSLAAPSRILRLYTEDEITVQTGVKYLRIYALSFLPVALSSIRHCDACKSAKYDFRRNFKEQGQNNLRYDNRPDRHMADRRAARITIRLCISSAHCGSIFHSFYGRMCACGDFVRYI